MKKYIFRLILFTLLLLSLTAILFYEILHAWFNPIFPFILLYFFILNSLQHASLLKTKEKKPMVFHTRFMVWIGVKLFVNMTIITVLVLIFRSEALSFALYFVSCYLFYSAFEVISLIKSLTSK